MTSRLDASCADLSDAVKERRVDLCSCQSSGPCCSQVRSSNRMSNTKSWLVIYTSCQRLRCTCTLPKRTHPCCNSNDCKANQRGQENETAQLFPNRETHSDHYSPAGRSAVATMSRCPKTCAAAGGAISQPHAAPGRRDRKKTTTREGDWLATIPIPRWVRRWP